MKKTRIRKKLLRFIEFLEDSIVVLLFAAISSISLLQIILRNFFDTGLSWATPITGILLLWLTLSAAVVAVRKDRHISINILAQNLAPLTECLRYTTTKLFAALVCATIAYYGGLFVQMDFKLGNTLYAEIPRWACEIIIPISFSMLSVRFFIAAIEEIHQFRRHQDS